MSSIENNAPKKKGVHFLIGLASITFCVSVSFFSLQALAGGKRGLPEDEDCGVIIKYNKTYEEHERNEEKDEIDPPPLEMSSQAIPQADKSASNVSNLQDDGTQEQPKGNFFSVLRAFKNWKPTAEHYLDILLQLHDCHQADGEGLNAIELVKLGYLLGHTPQDPLLAKHQALLYGGIETWSQGNSITEDPKTAETLGTLPHRQDAMNALQHNVQPETSLKPPENEPSSVNVSPIILMPSDKKSVGELMVENGLQFLETSLQDPITDLSAHMTVSELKQYAKQLGEQPTLTENQRNRLSELEEKLSLLELKGQDQPLTEHQKLLEQEEREDEEFRQELRGNIRYLAEALAEPEKIDLGVLEQYLRLIKDSRTYLTPTDPLHTTIETYEGIAQALLTGSKQTEMEAAIAVILDDNHNN